MSVSDILSKAADLIEPEGAWTQDAFARTDTGEPLNYPRTDGVCRCLNGAIWKASRRDRDDYQRSCDWIRGILRSRKETWSLAGWNDAPERTQAEVVAKLREAAALAKLDEHRGVV